MIISILLVFTFFPMLLAAIGFFLKLAGTIEEETVFYYIAGILLICVSLFSFTSGIEYETGANSTVTGNITKYVYNYTKADLQTSSLISLCLLVIGMFLVISAYNLKKNRRKREIEDEGDSSW